MSSAAVLIDTLRVKKEAVGQLVFTCVALANAGLVVGPFRPSVLTNGPLLGTLNFGNFV